MAEGIDSQLKRMMQDLKDIIGHINNSNINLNENEDPVSVFYLYGGTSLFRYLVDTNNLLIRPALYYGQFCLYETYLIVKKRPR